MPSFDIVSEIDLHEVTNAVDQASREVNQRFDFKGTNAKFELKEAVITLSAPADFQLKQMLEILKLKLSKRGIDVACMKVDEPVTTGQVARQVIHCGKASTRARQEAAAADQGLEAQGAGRDPGQAGARDRQEPRRPAGRDRAGSQGRARAAAAVHQLPGLTGTVPAGGLSACQGNVPVPGECPLR